MEASISRARVGVVLKAAQMRRRAFLCTFSRAVAWHLVSFHQAGLAYRILGMTQALYSLLSSDWLSPRTVFASMCSELTAISPLAAAILTWWLNRSFLSKWIPSHLTNLSGTRVLSTPSKSCKVIGGEQSYLRRLE